MQVSLQSLIDKVRRKAGVELSSFITTSEDTLTDTFIIDVINEAAAYLYQMMINSNEDYFVAKTMLAVSSGNEITLPSDFFKFRSLDKWLGGDGYIACQDFINDERNDFRGIYGLSAMQFGQLVPKFSLLTSTIELTPVSAAIGNYLLRYAPVYTNMVDVVNDKADFPPNWHDFIVQFAAIECKSKLLMDTNDMKEHLMKLEGMVKKGMARRGQPRRMAITSKRRPFGRF